jgi:hypothetical protein
LARGAQTVAELAIRGKAEFLASFCAFAALREISRYGAKLKKSRRIARSLATSATDLK